MGQGVFGHAYIYHNKNKYLVIQTTNHTISTKGVPNSVCQKFDSDGKLEKERQYDYRGRAELDIDYTNHGNPSRHPNVPHAHKRDWSNPNNPIRSKYDD